MKVAVLGYGPAGLIAAHTLFNGGLSLNDIDIIGAGGKSVIGGAQYLHEPIINPYRTEPDGEITFVKIGDRDGYAKKVYDDPGVDVSWDHYEGVVPAWSLQTAYDILWDTFVDRLIHDTLDMHGAGLLLDSGKYDLIFSSIPAACLCYGHHAFPQASIKLINAGPVKVDNVVLYSGRPDDKWYRTSCIFGEAWTEFNVNVINAARYCGEELIEGMTGLPRILEAHEGFKPLGTDCDCLPDIVRIGRFGLWDRKILLHHVPHQVRAALSQRSLA